MDVANPCLHEENGLALLTDDIVVDHNVRERDIKATKTPDAI